MNNIKWQQVSVAVLIEDRARILTVKRSEKETFLPGLYEIPGGKVNHGEAPEEAVMREVLEETGLEIKDIELISVRSYLSKAAAQHNVELVYSARLASDSSKLTLSDAHDAFLWVSRSEVQQLNLPDGDPIKIILVHWFDNLYSRQDSSHHS